MNLPSYIRTMDSRAPIAGDSTPALHEQVGPHGQTDVPSLKRNLDAEPPAAAKYPRTEADGSAQDPRSGAHPQNGHNAPQASSQSIQDGEGSRNGEINDHKDGSPAATADERLPSTAANGSGQQESSNETQTNHHTSLETSAPESSSAEVASATPSSTATATATATASPSASASTAPASSVPASGPIKTEIDGGAAAVAAEDAEVKVAATSEDGAAAEEEQFEHAVIVPKRAPQLQFYGKKTGISYDVRMRYHSRLVTEPISYIDPHPEDPRRTFRIYRSIAEAGLIEDETLQGGEKLGDLMLKLPTREATGDELSLVHSKEHLKFIASTEDMSPDSLNFWTEKGDSIYLNNDSYEAAKLSVGGAIEACRGVIEGRVKNALAVIRPPGHHAEPGSPSGFCLFANVAVASQVMLRDYPDRVRKILIFDWDVHHGNGTQRAFLDDDRVLYVSIHRYDNGQFYPGTKFGGADVVGEGQGEGYSVNIPWSSGGMGDGDYITAFHKIVMPIACEFDPDLVIVSAGFDAAEKDPIGGCHVSPMGYQHMLHMLMSLADGKVVVALEGGYNLDAISRSALAITKVLLGDPPGHLQSSLASDAALEVFSEVQTIQSRYWKSMGPPTIKFEPEIEVYNQQQLKRSEEAEQAREQPEEKGRKPKAVEQQPLVDASPSEKDENEIPILQSLLTVVRGYETQQLGRKYGMARLPLLRALKNETYENEILSTPDVFTKDKVLLFFYGPSLVWAHKDPITGRIRPDESVVANPAVEYIRWAVQHGYAVLDIFLSPLESMSPAKFVPRFCENTVRYFRAHSIVILGAGQAYSYAIQTAAHRDLKDRLRAFVSFLGPEDTLRQFPTSSDEAAVRRFHNHSLVLMSSKHPTWSQKYARKKCGRLVRAPGENLYAVMRQSFEEATEYIEAEELGDEDSEEDSDEE